MAAAGASGRRSPTLNVALALPRAPCRSAATRLLLPLAFAPQFVQLYETRCACQAAMGPPRRGGIRSGCSLRRWHVGPEGRLHVVQTVLGQSKAKNQRPAFEKLVGFACVHNAGVTQDRLRGVFEAIGGEPCFLECAMLHVGGTAIRGSRELLRLWRVLRRLQWLACVKGLRLPRLQPTARRSARHVWSEVSPAPPPGPRSKRRRRPRRTVGPASQRNARTGSAAAGLPCPKESGSAIPAGPRTAGRPNAATCERT